MAESLRDYFVKFIFKNEGAEKISSAVGGIERGLDRAGAKAFSFNEKLRLVQNVIKPFRELAEMVHATAMEADALGDLAERTGFASAEIEKLGFVAKLSGTNQETMTTGLRILEKQMGEVAQGSKAQTATFAKLGINIHGAGGKIKTVSELLPDVAKAFEKIPGHAHKPAYAKEHFGRLGQELLPMLANGPEKLREMQEELELLGGVTSDKFMAAASEYADNVDRLSAAWKGVRQAVSGPIVDAVNKLVAGFLTWWKVAGKLVREKISEWSDQLVTSLQALWFTVNKLATPLLLFAAALNVPLLAMIATRLIIGLLIDDFANFMAGNDSIIGRVIANWDEWLDTIAETNPIMATVLATVGDIVKWITKKFQALPVEWDKFVATLVDGTWVDAVKEMFSSLTSFIDEPLEAMAQKIRTTIFDSILFLKNTARTLGLDSLADSLGGAASSFIKGGVGNGAERILPSNVLSGSSMAGISNNSSQSASNTQVAINVQATPGMNERALAEETRKQFDREMERQIRGAYNVTVPEAY